MSAKRISDAAGKNVRARRADDLLQGTSGDRYQYDAQVGHLLRRALQVNLSIFAKHFASSDLTSVQFIVLCALAAHGPISQNLVGRLVALDPSTTKGVVERLAERRLISIDADAGDRRKLVIQLTRAGKVMLPGLINLGLKVTEETFGPLNSAERIALVYLLNKMVEKNGP
jgi:MarR family transcriptional regulator, lower aerobic nicotinate degradation pathway regulator